MRASWVRHGLFHMGENEATGVWEESRGLTPVNRTAPRIQVSEPRSPSSMHVASPHDDAVLRSLLK